jgi:hypothetical protein
MLVDLEVEYRLLGSLEVQSNGRVVDLGPRKQRALLAILLLHGGEIVATDRLIELVWATIRPAPRRTRSRSTCAGFDAPSAKRRRHEDTGYVLRAVPDAIDALRFRRLVAEGGGALGDGDQKRGAGWCGRRSSCGAARHCPTSHTTSSRASRSAGWRSCGSTRSSSSPLPRPTLAQGRGQDALSRVEAAVEVDPLRERLRELQMLALYRCGRHPDAPRAYQQFHRLLADELGLAPSPSLRRLNERILLHDRSLSPEAIAPAAPIRNRTRACGRSRRRTPTTSSAATASWRRSSRRSPCAAACELRAKAPPPPPPRRARAGSGARDGGGGATPRRTGDSARS